MSVHWPIIKRCLMSPGRVAAIDDRGPRRAIELVVGALHLASVIEARCRTRTVAVLLPTGTAFPIAALAGWMTGRAVVPLNYLLARDELQYVIDDCETDTIITAGPLLEFMGFSPRAGNLIRLEELDFSGFPEPFWPEPARDEDLAVLLYTSGTSGKPKGVMLTHGNIESNIRQVQSWVELTSRDTLLGVLPQFHSFGLTVLTLLPLALGVKVVYTARFVPQRIVKLLREHRPTLMVAIPSMYNALLHVKDGGPEDFSSLRFTVSGGEPLPDAVFRRFRERFGVTLNEGYGLTETSPITNWCRPEEWRPHSVGRPLPGVVERIIDINSGADLGPGQDGEIWIGGPNVMAGYYKLPAETAAALTPDRFLRTGDIGRLDDDGHLFITGRLKEMLIVGGENVFPREIEEVLNRHPSVKDSGVVGLHDPIRGELPVAFIELKEGAEFDAQSILNWCRDHLAGYKVPREIRRVEALPRNPTGKIMRRSLKSMLAGPAATA
ncbi:MAG: AMP-binding protein [Phycisphaerales bacterium]|nr:AMP-binding protein [Phycisphaerales bacterium]